MTARPRFAGVHRLLSLIRQLAARPPFTHRAPDLQVRGDEPLPLVCLVGREAPDRFLTALESTLGDASPRIPHALVDADTAGTRSAARWGLSGEDPAAAAAAREPPLLPLLDELSFRLAADSFGAGRLTRFDHYRLADWLSGHRLPPARGRDDRSAVLALLRTWSGRAPQPVGAAGTDPSVSVAEVASGVWTRLGLWLLMWVGQGAFRRWLSQRPAGLGREARWFMRRQPYMVPRHSTDFLGFAERLTLDRRSFENAEQVKKLLVHAFLEDLRAAYRRRRWRWFPRRSGWRRTAYVTVLVSNATDDNGGWELLRLINAVRNETGELDPLLVVAACDRPPDRSGGTDGRPMPAHDADRALQLWRRGLPHRRQLLATDARYLVLDLPEPVPPGRVGALAADDAAAWDPSETTWRLPPPPRLARRGAVEGLLAVALVAVLAAPLLTVRQYWQEHCSVLRSQVDAAVSVELLRFGPDDMQCVGHSDSAAQVFGTNARLRAAQLRVFAGNETAARKLAAIPHRPMISLVYFAGLTHAGSDLDTDHAVAEELEGIALAQQQQHAASSLSEPLVRVVIANAGRGMRQAHHVAQQHLIPLIDADDSIKGVIGMDRTVPETEEAIRILGEAGIPVFGTTLTGTGLAELSQLYFQLVPDNTRQAELVARYAAHIGRDKVTVYHPPIDPDHPDEYVKTLRDAIADRMGEAVELVDWRDDVNELPPPCRRPDWAQAYQRELFFYAGRENHYRDFLRTMNDGCVDSDRTPHIVADDAVTRAVAQASFRTDDTFAGSRVRYVGLGSLVVLGGRDCVTYGRPAPALSDMQPMQSFCSGYQRLRARLAADLPTEELPATSYPGERVGVAYDTVRMLVDLVRLGGRHRWHRAALVQLLREPGYEFLGASGVISFSASRIGDSRNIAILELAIPPSGDPQSREPEPSCVFLIGDLYRVGEPGSDTGNGCPVAPDD
ncbi:hypothetical protein O7608_11000 [Solwaraspora sp. WMMA2056]|uniref:hypothetical protein n=1 Tax=Solwaraspora sp. WMMA2056 TaxID=3015161 RepID=UPI00259B824A|nr:hypothetical protein [Solwaraspora sp. WMMA2056]WJK42863.1 hypothetical protein O7608_11000 [Solwaraspora sp. WMMA2056]